MHLNRGQLPTLARQIVRALIAAELIEVTTAREVEQDVESVLSSYQNQSDQVQQRARELVQQRGLPQGEFSRAKRLAAEQAGIKIGDDALDYVLSQIIEMLLHSASVEEVFGEDNQLKLVIRKFLREDDDQTDRVEAQIRSRLKHVQEGTRMWEIEYERMRADINRRRGE